VVSQRTKGPGDATAPLPPWHTAMRWEYLLLSAGRKRVVSGMEVRALQEGLCPFFSVPDVIRLGKEGANPHIKSRSLENQDGGPIGRHRCFPCTGRVKPLRWDG